MNKLLIAVTYHNQDRSTLHRTLRSTQFRDHLPNNWRTDTVVFYYDKVPWAKGFHTECTGEESLGGKRNHAVRYARANNYQLIAFLDDDDLFGPSWVPKLCAQAEMDFQDGVNDRIYHPQWNVLFEPRGYVVREHFGQSDPRFDSRDMMFYNPWSALCAFSPMDAKWQYRKHLKSDQRLSFEDWSFNLDSWCGGQEHVVLPDTYHFLRLRENSLGKSTIHNALEHTKFFKSPELIRKTIATMDLPTAAVEGSKDLIDGDKFRAEMQAIVKIDPQLYYWRVPSINQQYNNRAGRAADLVCDVVKQMPFCRDVFWMHDHKRIGGAEKALAWSAEFLQGFKDSDGAIPHQVWIDDVVVDVTNPEMLEQWRHGMTHLLRVWAQERREGKGQARSLHICNTGPGWDAIVQNPALFDGVQVYLYLFNDDLMFPSGKWTMDKAGYHSPIYNCSHLLDRPNFHIICDSDHHSKRLAEITGLGDKVRKIAIPVRGMPNKRRDCGSPDESKILWAGRMDHFKGVEDLLSYCAGLHSRVVHVAGDGPASFTDMVIAAASNGHLIYHGRYDSFANIPGEYDFLLFTSEREGMPNVVREALASGLPVLAKEAPWTEEVPLVRTYSSSTTIYQAIEEMAKPGDKDIALDDIFSREACEPLSIAAYREALV